MSAEFKVIYLVFILRRAKIENIVYSGLCKTDLMEAAFQECIVDVLRKWSTFSTA